MRRFSLIAVSIVVCLVLGHGAAWADDVNADLLQAESLSSNGKNDQAVALLNRYLTAHPQDARALVDRGDAYQNEGKLRESIVDYTAAIAINPQYAYAYASRADSYNQIGDYASAISDCNKALALKPNYAYAFRVRGIAHLDKNEVAEARADFHQAIGAEPNDAYTYALACWGDREANQLDVAQKECATALQINPSSYRGLFEEGRLQIAQSAWSDADAWFTKALAASNNDDPASNYWRALARLNLHQAEGAFADINIYVKAAPNDGDGLFLRALIDQIRGDVAAAKKDAASASQLYGVDNDTDGMAKAKALLQQLNAP